MIFIRFNKCKFQFIAVLKFGLIILYCFNISTTKLEAPMYFENELPTNYSVVQPKVCHLMGNVIKTVRSTGSDY